MLKPVSTVLEWHGPIPAFEAFDAQSKYANQFNFPGVYLQVLRGPGGIVASYLGKHEVSVFARQQEHYANILAGKYNLFNSSGHRTFSSFQPRPKNFTDLAEEHISITEVYFGEMMQLPYASSSHWAQAIESLLLYSMNWRNNGGVIINRGWEPEIFGVHDSFEVEHRSSPAILGLFGQFTRWDRKSQTVV